MEVAEQLKQISRQLDGFGQQFNRLEDRVIAIDTSIQGDTARGTEGLKQHIEKLEKNHLAHVQEDIKQFTEVYRVQGSITKKITSIKGWVAGAAFFLTGAIGLLAYGINVWISLYHR